MDLESVKFSVKSYLKQYDVFISPGIIVENNDDVFRGLRQNGTIVLVDKNILKLYPDLDVVRRAGENIISIEATENKKSIDGVTELYRSFLSKGVKRDWNVIAIGGGIVQDLAGFTCHTYMRGLKWTFIPTTLLAQADSCIGSKTSINFEDSKNILGSFYPPEKIFIDSLFLKSLDRENILNGIGEIVKVHCMDKIDNLRKLMDDLDRLKKLEPEYLGLYIKQSLDIKRKLIESDEFDKGIRLQLNYGHCFGHALEAASDFSIPHGIGVSFGIEYANLLSLRRSILPQEEYNIMHQAIKSMLNGYRTAWVDPEKTIKYLKRDKKRTGEGLSMIISEGIGRQRKIDDVSFHEFYDVCNDFKNAMESNFSF